MDLEINGDFPALTRVLRVLIDAWPEHSSYLQKSFPAEDSALLRHADQVAALIAALAKERLPQICGDYRWTCEKLLEKNSIFAVMIVTGWTVSRKPSEKFIRIQSL